MVVEDSLDGFGLLILDKSDQILTEAIFKKFDYDDYPWLLPHGTTILNIMVGSTLAALQLVCKVNHLNFDGGDLFMKCSVDHLATEHAHQADKAWRETFKQHEA